MPRPDGRLEQGQPIRDAISARAWNRAQDAADLVLGARAGTEGVYRSPVLKPYTWAYCQASATFERWDVVAITGVAITPTSDADAEATKSFQDTPVLMGDTPSETTTAWAIAVEPIEQGKIGRVAVGGVVQCKIDIEKAEDEFVACKDGGLKTGSSGEGVILWKESGTGSDKWAIVRLAGSGSGIKRGTFSGTWTKGSTKTVTDSITSSVTYENVQNYIASLAPPGTMGCSIACVGEEWVLVSWDWHSLDGYSGSDTQVLAHDTDGLKWISTTDCDTP